MRTTSQILDRAFQNRFEPSNILAQRGIFPLDSFNITIARDASCFAKGTMMTMADGSEKAVETLVAATPSNQSNGDVFLSVDGVETYVVALAAGPRPEPCIRISARAIAPELSGKTFRVMVSMKHTISVDYSRMVFAWFLRKGDYICTNYGKAIIENIEMVDYDDEVWNVYLGSSYFVNNVLPNLTTDRLYYHLTNSSLGLTPKQHLIFGNGVLSGDLYVQIRSADLARIGYSLNSYV